MELGNSLNKLLLYIYGIFMESVFFIQLRIIAEIGLKYVRENVKELMT